MTKPRIFHANPFCVAEFQEARLGDPAWHQPFIRDYDIDNDRRIEDFEEASEVAKTRATYRSVAQQLREVSGPYYGRTRWLIQDVEEPECEMKKSKPQPIEIPVSYGGPVNLRDLRRIVERTNHLHGDTVPVVVVRGDRYLVTVVE
jgi:allophanate hydrolase subunit 1